MARILTFPPADPRPTRGAAQTTAQEAAEGELVAMRHIDLDTVVKTVRLLRDVGRSHLLDAFNGGRASFSARPAPAAVPATAPSRHT